MTKLLIILISLLVLTVFSDFVLLRIFAGILKKKFQNSEKTNKQQKKGESQQNVNAKKTLYAVFIDYLYSLSNLTITFVGWIPSFRVRTFIYKHIFLMEVGKNTKIRGNIEFLAPWNIKIGDNCLIGRDCKMDGRHGLTIGSNVNISDFVALWTAQHEIDSPDFAGCGDGVVVKDRVWLCFRCIVLPGTTINEGCVLAANSVLTKDCEEYSVYAGTPAKKIKSRNRDLTYKLDVSSMHFY